MARGLFVTGTDTGVGKTVVAVAALRGLVVQGVRAVGMKPVSAGICADTGRNEDVDALAVAGNVRAPTEARNPYAFADAAAPHLVARNAQTTIEIERIRDAYATLAARADAIVVEGAGGAMVPLSDRLDMLDIARALRLPVLLVVGVRLGCLNHARLSALAIRARGLKLQGWVASILDPAMPYLNENVAWLTAALAADRVADVATPEPAPFTEDVLRRLALLDSV